MGSSLFTQSLTLRWAIANDAAWAAPLLLAAGPALFSYILASPSHQAEDILYQAFQFPHHAFSYEHTQVVEVEGHPVGLLISYPGALKRQADEKVHFVMARIMPLRKLPKILVNVADFSRIKQEVALNDYYILGVSVLPQFQHRGIGSYLLSQAEQQAAAQNCDAICTDVAYNNAIAKQMLEKRGYTIALSKTTDRFEQMTRAGGIHRLMKPLNPG
ncbi:MAG: GNAT family N-acetyltransferase [Oscillatoriales cyanobacterium C42_A2020_001]|nr:GNAT family N-acetyltransferase [Leptolyngbyaceae cyanobacterium C42_A2020_001]